MKKRVTMTEQLIEEKERLGFAPKRTEADDAESVENIRNAIIKKTKQAVSPTRFITTTSRRVQR